MSCLHIFYKNDNEYEYEYEMDSFSYSYTLSMLTLSNISDDQGMKTHLSCHELPKSLWKRYSSNNENHNSWIHKTAVIKSNKTPSYDTKYIQ